MKIYFVWIVSLTSICCSTTGESGKDLGADSFSLVGTMNYRALEGGCWQFTTDRGTTYQLSGEEVERLLQDGRRAEVIVREVPNRRTICMTGKTVELLKIIKIY